MSNDDKILKILESLLEGQKRLEYRMDKSDDTQARIITALEALAAGQNDLIIRVAKIETRVAMIEERVAKIDTRVASIEAKQKELATKQDVEATIDAAKADLKVELASKTDMLDLGTKIDKNTRSYKIRLEELEKDAGIRNRGKN